MRFWRSQMNKSAYIIPVLLFLIGACTGNHTVNKQLRAAEELIPEAPDSALSILVGMDTARMSQKQMARQNILYIYANVIHGNPIGLDSLTLAEGDGHFSGEFNSDGVKWLIIKSADARIKGDPITNIENLKDAEFLAMRIDDKFDLGIIYQMLARVYEQGFNGTVSKYYADKAVSLFRDLKTPTHLRNARMAIVGAYAVSRDYKTMRDSLLAMKPEVMANASKSYQIYFLDQLARSYDTQSQTKEAISVWHSIFDGKDVSSNSLAHWAHAYCHVGQLDSAYLLIQKAINLPHGNSDEYLCRNVEHDILEKMGRKPELARVDSLREIAAEKTMTDRHLEERSLVINVKYENAARNAWIEAEEARTRTGIAIFVAVIVVLIAVSGGILLRKRNQLLRLEHENDLLRIRAMQDNLFESDSRNKDMSAKITELFHTRFKLIDGLAATYFECIDTGQEQKRIYADVKSSLSNFSSEEATRELAEIVNGYNDNLMDKFRTDFPKLPVSQYRLVLYLFCGFSLPSISIFTGTELRNVYVYKSRLKSTISKSDSPMKAKYLEYFS